MGYDHKEVRCAAMEEYDLTCKLVGEPRTCCVCEDHDCDVARTEIERSRSEKAKQEENGDED